MKTFCRTPLLLRVLSILSFAITTFSFAPNISHFIYCGSTTPYIIFNDFPTRNFTADGSYLISGKDSSTSLPNPNRSFSVSLYSTARVSSTNFKYRFNMEPNSSNILRLHFLPFTNQSIDLSAAKFSVQALNSYTLLDNFSVSDTSSPIIKEFILWAYSSDLDVEFIPEINSRAFVSAIEAFTAPTELLNRPPKSFIGDAKINGDLNKQVLETMYRVNMLGPLITPKNDTLWRTWVTDDLYISNGAAPQNVTVSSGSLIYNSYEGSTQEIAPPKVYSTARALNVSRIMLTSVPGFNINITWSFNVSAGYQYLIRLHFCDILSNTNTASQGLVFTVYIMNYLALSNDLKVSQYVSNIFEPFYIDFIAHVPTTQKMNVSISLDTKDTTEYYAFLNGLEIMKVNSHGRSANPSSRKNKLPVILAASIGGGVVIALILSCILLALCKKRQQKPQPDAKENQLMWSPVIGGINSVNISNKSGSATTISPSPRVDLGLLISFAQIKRATDNFDEKNLIGVGGFGKVYKGVLRNGIEVAVKRATARSQQGFPEFQTEIEVLSQIRHRHLVSLIGYCDERSEMILVYEYMEKGPLRNYLYGSNGFPCLSWNQRLKICIEAAKGLHYLHTGHSQTIIHRDVKSTNILLGEGFMAKVSDFGLSKLGASIEETHVSTAVKGTFGYLDPEYYKTQKLTDKSDVYSFGVTLLEVLCARPVINPSLPREEINLAEWALEWQRHGQLEKIIDRRIAKEINENSLRKFWELTEKCLREFGMERPTIGDVLWNLEYCLQLQETDVRREPYEDSGASEAYFQEVPLVRRMPSSVMSTETGNFCEPYEDSGTSEAYFHAVSLVRRMVNRETGTSGDSKSDVTNSSVFSQLVSKEGR